LSGMGGGREAGNFHSEAKCDWTSSVWGGMRGKKKVDGNPGTFLWYICLVGIEYGPLKVNIVFVGGKAV